MVTPPIAHSSGTVPVPLPPPEPVRIASFNTAAFLGVKKAVADVQRVAQTGADVIALQEMSSFDRRQAVRAALVDCATCVYGIYVAPGGPVPAGTPILYRRDRFWLLEAGSVKVTDAVRVGSRGAGPEVIRPKYVNWVRLKDMKTRRQVYVLNNHTVPTVQAPGGGPNSNTARLTIYRKHMKGLLAVAGQLRSRGGAVVVTGDFNVNYRTDRVVGYRWFPYAALHTLNVRASFELLGEPALGTHILPSGFDMRLIDYVSVMDHRVISALGQQILVGLNSDHRPMVVDLGLKYKRKFYAPTPPA